GEGAGSRSERDGTQLSHAALACVAPRRGAATGALSVRRRALGARIDLEDRPGGGAARPQQWCGLRDPDLFPTVRRDDDTGLHVRLRTRRATDRMGHPAAARTLGDTVAAVILHLSLVGKSYHTPSGQLDVLGRIDLALGEREIVAIIGPSGCGKS